MDAGEFLVIWGLGASLLMAAIPLLYEVAGRMTAHGRTVSSRLFRIGISVAIVGGVLVLATA